jgi:hypothetical protein
VRRLLLILAGPVSISLVGVIAGLVIGELAVWVYEREPAFDGHEASALWAVR